MARQSRQQDAVAAGESSADEEQHQQGSSESAEEEDDMIRVGEKMLQASRKRRDSRRKIIENDHKKSVKDAKTKIIKIYKDRDAKVKKHQNAQLQRLGDLLKKRRAVETRIFAHINSIVAARVNLSTSLDAVFDGRLEEIADLGKADEDRLQLSRQDVSGESL